MRQRLLGLTLVLAAAHVAGVAEAAPPTGKGPPPSARSSTQFALRREDAGGADGVTARARARAGDCAGALPAFDAAVRVTIEPTLRRDRGLCHEKLGNPFPAIEDYRAYLVARADAPDADQIRDRLARLEEQAGVGGPSAQAVKDRDDPNGFKAGGQFSLGTDAAGHSSSSSSSSATADKPLGPKSGEQERSFDYYAKQEKLADSADSSALRNGSGFVLGPFVSIPRYFVGDSRKGVQSELSYAVGAALRYSFGGAASLISELGYAGIGTSGEIGAFSGPLVFVGLELRIPISRYASDQLLLGIGPGWEHYTVSGLDGALNVFAGRGRFGYRHVFGPSVGLEVTVDGGPAYFKASGGGDGKLVGLIGGSYAVVIAF